MVPKRIHFVFGIDKGFCGKPLAFFHYIAVKSFKDIHPDYEIRFHVCYEPQGKWWDAIKELVTLVWIREENIPSEIFGKKIVYPEHKGDIIRLNILNEEGGIYADIDTICVRRFDIFMSSSFVMGREIYEETLSGLCNALMIAEPGSEFGTRWSAAYAEFNPHDWNQMSVRVPYRLAEESPTAIRVEPPASFFKFMWDSHGRTQMFETIAPIEDCYSIHLWETKMYECLSAITPESIRQRDTTYNILSRLHI